MSETVIDQLIKVKEWALLNTPRIYPCYPVYYDFEAENWPDYWRCRWGVGYWW